MGTAYNTVFVGSYASSNPPSAGFTNTETVIRHCTEKGMKKHADNAA